MIKQKNGQMEFGWLFSLIIGAVIIFLAIFFAGKIFTTGTHLSDVETLRTFDILLNPFSSVGSIASLTLSKSIEMPYNTELNLSCFPSGTQEGQRLSLRTIDKKTTGDWVSYNIKNKYIFGNTSIQGKTFWTFSKPFEFPWRVDDLIYIISENYCFIDNGMPSSIKKELSMINASVIQIVSNQDDCEEAITVCFSGCSGQDVIVNYGDQTVAKDRQHTMIFADDASMYAAIFSNNQLYNCNIQRLLTRLQGQIGIYKAWAMELNREGCENQLLIDRLNAFNAGTSLNPYIISRAGSVKEADSYNCPIIQK